ncbi:hypothetical protein Taro_019398 [Colocasia esculenta]|uniref:CCHC-type domain-containing protein n=1 Tax=Colocasia esculenta TaxID=4460 RepID=A0A843V227_COLES|nr:hypothetical protein [Colocasia esculenta]
MFLASSEKISFPANKKVVTYYFWEATGNIEILKKKNGSRRIQKKERKEKEPVCYECRKPGHLRPDCLRLKKTSQTEKSKKHHKKFKRKALAAAWENEEATSSDSSSSSSEKEQVNLALIVGLDESLVLNPWLHGPQPKET